MAEEPTGTHSAGESRTDDIVTSYARAFPEADVEALATHIALASASTEIVRSIERRISELGFDLSRPRYTIVRMLYLSPGQSLSQSDIAKALNVSGASVSQLIDGLASSGWVERSPDPADRRFTLIKLTEPGMNRCARLVPAILDLMLDSCRTLTPQERAQLRYLVGKVVSRVGAYGD